GWAGPAARAAPASPPRATAGSRPPPPRGPAPPPTRAASAPRWSCPAAARRAPAALGAPPSPPSPVPDHPDAARPPECSPWAQDTPSRTPRRGRGGNNSIAPVPPTRPAPWRYGSAGCIPLLLPAHHHQPHHPLPDLEFRQRQPLRQFRREEPAAPEAVAV